MKSNLIATFSMFFTLLTAGCATMNKEECARADWKHVGLVDGRSGKEANFIDEHRKACGALMPNAAAYEEGRLRGLKEYCTPRSAYNEGASGRQLTDVCPQELQDELVSQHGEGHKTFELKMERKRAKDDLEKERERIAKDKTVVGDVANVITLVTGRSRTQDEEDRVNRLSDQINSRDARAPAGPAPVPSLNERIEANPAPAARGLLAITTGSVFGFGIGHSILGTYRRQGWKWTAIDVANIVGLSVTSANCSTAPDPVTGERGSKNTGACIASTISLVGGLIVSRVWQGIELGKASSSAFSPYNMAIIPKADGATLQAAYNW